MRGLLCFYALVVFLSSGIALAQDPIAASAVCTSVICQVMGKFPEFNAWLIAIFTFLGIVLRAGSELMAFVALQLDKSDHGWANKLAEWSMWCAKAIGWFGGGKSQKIFIWDQTPDGQPVVQVASASPSQPSGK